MSISRGPQECQSDVPVRTPPSKVGGPVGGSDVPLYKNRISQSYFVGRPPLFSVKKNKQRARRQEKEEQEKEKEKKQEKEYIYDRQTNTGGEGDKSTQKKHFSSTFIGVVPL